MLIGDQILADGIGFTPGKPLELYWDDVYINTYIPGTDGAFTTYKSPDEWGYTVEDFGNVYGPCSSNVRALQGGHEWDYLITGYQTGYVVWTLLGAGDKSILTDGDNLTPGAATCQAETASYYAPQCIDAQQGKGSCPISPHSVVVDSGESSTDGVTLDVVDNAAGVIFNGAAIHDGQHIYIGLDHDTAEGFVTTGNPPVPPPDIESGKPSGEGVQPCPVTLEDSTVTGRLVCTASYSVPGNLTMNNAVLWIPGDLVVNGNLTGTGAIWATGRIIVGGKVSLLPDYNDVLISTGDIYLCGGSTAGLCGSLPTPVATPTSIGPDPHAGRDRDTGAVRDTVTNQAPHPEANAHIHRYRNPFLHSQTNRKTHPDHQTIGDRNSRADRERNCGANRRTNGHRDSSSGDPAYHQTCGTNLRRVQFHDRWHRVHQGLSGQLLRRHRQRSAQRRAADA